MITIKEIRLTTGLSQTKFAERYGLPLDTLQNWETGRRQPSDYVVLMLAKLVALDDNVETKAWYFVEQRDSAGTGSMKRFPDRYEAIRYAEEEWDHKSQRDQESYRAADGDLFLVAELNVFWDDTDLEFVPDLGDFDPVWSAPIKG